MSNQLPAIEISNSEKNLIILLNVLKMLSERGLIKKENVEKKYESIKNTISSGMIYKVKTDVGQNYILKLVSQKITTINKALGVSDFLANYKDDNKIIIVEDINKKAYKQIVEFPNTEVFWKFEFMMNLIDHAYIPEHQVLPIGFHPDESNEKYKNHEKFEETYFVSKRECPKLEVTDPVARYYNLVPGQYVRIKRESISSGYAPTYRIVINAPISKLFDRS